MNGVDRVDQMRSTNPTKRKETKIHTSVWTYCLDFVIHQAYCIYKLLIAEGKISEIRTSDEDEEAAGNRFSRRLPKLMEQAASLPLRIVFHYFYFSRISLQRVLQH